MVVVRSGQRQRHPVRTQQSVATLFALANNELFAWLCIAGGYQLGLPLDKRGA